jgi:hypothetical protein
MVSGIDATTCAITWRTGKIMAGVITPDKPIKNQPGSVSFSPDGQVAFNYGGKLVVALASDLAKNKPV